MTKATYYILSGEGENGSWDKLETTALGLKKRLTRERCGGDRWAKAFTLSDGILHPEEDGYESRFHSARIEEEATS